MVVMAMLFATGGLYLSVRAGIDEIIDRQFGADLFAQPQIPDDGSLLPKLAAQQGVERVTPIRFGISTSLDKQGKRREIFVRTIEPATYFETSSYFWREGNDADAKAALERGNSVLLTREVGEILDLGVGDKITLETTKDKHAFNVAAIYVGQPGPPELTMGIKDARQYLSAGPPLGYALKVTDGERASAVARDMKVSLKSYQLETQTAAESKEQARGQITTYFQIIYAILLIAAIVGLLGLANTLAMSVLQRFREIGILRAIGVTRSQSWRMVLVESATMGLTAFILSLPLGGLLTYLVVRGTSDGFGFTVPTLYPWSWVPFVALFAIFISAVAAIAPGRRAARLHVVNALQYE
jgi:putative ABC transport system permease protein